MDENQELREDLKFYIENIEFGEGEINKAEFVNKNFDPEKATDRFVQGYASTPAWDSDGESIVKSGLDITYYNNQGWLNFMHNNSPSHVIGIPIYSKIDHIGFFTKGMLFKNIPIAEDVWKLAQELKSLGNPRRLGFSIEGKVVQRSAINKSKIVKAKVTNVAVTHIPVNTTCTFEVVSKSFVPPSYDEIVTYIQKDLAFQKDLAAIGSVGAVAGHSWGSSNYTGTEPLRVESLDGDSRKSDEELERRLTQSYKDAKKSHEELAKLLKAIHPEASDVLVDEVINLVRKADGFENFAKIIEESQVLK